MPSNQEYKGKGMKGRNYDESSGVGTSSAGVTGTTGNLNDGGRDGGVGTPDSRDSGNLQSGGHGQPGGTPAQGNSWRGQGNQQQGGQQGQQQSHQQSQQQDPQQDQRRPAPGPLTPDDLGSDGNQQR